jgi:hypothetical protein
MPVVRTLYWPLLLPQLALVLALALIASLCVPTLPLPTRVIVAAVGYLLFCRTMRGLLAKDHLQGMRAFRQGRFGEALAHFEASRAFFCAHTSFDGRWRSLLFGVAGYNSYRVMALLNAAFCHAQLGDGAKAITLYEQVLRESPGNTLASVSLRMLGASGSAKPEP